MRKMPKKLLTIVTAATLSLGALALPACTTFPALNGDFSGEVASNGGFIVEKGNYYYFINGVEAQTSDNTYGTPVKGALMRVLKSDVDAKKNNAEIVVPSLMVSADYTSGIYVYGERVYFATPNNVKSTSGTIDTSHLVFQSAKLDGTDVKSYFTLPDSSTVYRYVEVDGTVYVVFVESSALKSYNTASGVETVLAESVTGQAFNKDNVSDPYVYYTMDVKLNIDSEGATTLSYNQVYRVRADATEAPYEYKYDEKYLEDNDGELPYVNLGEIVFDGIGANDAQGNKTQFTHDLTDGVVPEAPSGYTYSLQSYQNDGLYFTREAIDKTSTTGETGWLYYTKTANFDGADWNSITGNANEYLDCIAKDTTHASSSAVFYKEGDEHCFIYVDGSNMFRAEVNEENGAETATLIARNVSGATLVRIDDSAEDYKYVYYTNSGSSGKTINRVAYNGTEEDYKVLNYDNVAYQPVSVLDIEHASSWYSFEILNGKLFYADAKAYGSNGSNYVAYVDLSKDGKIINNAELKALNEKYDAIVGEDGYLAELDDDDYSNLSDAIEYYFYWGSDSALYLNDEDFDGALDKGYLKYEYTQVKKNIDEAIDGGKKGTYLYSEEEQEMFEAWVNGTGKAEEFVDENGESYRTRGYFVTRLGQFSETEQDALHAYLRTSLQSYTATEEEEEMPVWAWVLIGVGIGIVVVGIGLAVFFILRGKNKNMETTHEERMYVDTTDDKEMDVYAEMDAETVEPTEEVEEAESEEVEEVEETEPVEEDDKVIEFPTATEETPEN